jgi:3-oxoacyl-[acyl-carrier protein] reductase
MDLQLNGKTALITGSSRGIGLAIAATLQAEGCHIVMNARNEIELAAAVASLPGAVAVVGDMTDPISAQSVVRRAVGKLGKLDILVCNVGGGASVPPGEETAAEWQPTLLRPPEIYWSLVEGALSVSPQYAAWR